MIHGPSRSQGSADLQSIANLRVLGLAIRQLIVA